MALDYKKYGEAIKQHRKAMHLSQTDVYKMTGISVDTQRIIEGGNREPRISTLERLSEVYKTDLIFLLTKYRDENDFFSNKLIDEANLYLNQLDMQAFYDRINELIEGIMSSYEKDSSKPSNLEFVHYLRSFKDIKVLDASFKEQNVASMEKLLMYLSRTDKGILEDPALLNLEIQTGITLANYYRYLNEFDKAISLLERVIGYLESVQFKSLNQVDYLVNATAHLCTVYHRMDQHQQVINLVDTTLHRNNLYYCREAITGFLIRKAVALFHLKNDDYKSLLATVVLIETPKRLSSIRKSLMNNYGFDIVSFVHTEQRSTIDEMNLNDL